MYAFALILFCFVLVCETRIKAKRSEKKEKKKH
jgi:hypothetical protein